MPTLNWIGKDKVISHHLDVPLRILDKTSSFGDPCAARDNRIIHGDNLEALKALMPEYEGRIQCVYIDPPYNTGNEGWVYNDNVSDPRLGRWLNQVVGKEGEDLSRHDKWLCMMYPRLKLLHRLLDENGSIWISIDDNEQANLKLMMDEIFGERNFIATVIWQKVYSPKNSAMYFSEDHDFILVYAKNALVWRPILLPRSDEQNGRYANPDDDPRGPWKPGDLSARNSYSEGTYAITCPSGRIIDAPPSGRYWVISNRKFQEFDRDNRIWWGKNGNNVPSIKRFLCEVKQGITPQTLWKYDEVGHTQDAKKELLSILDFETSADVFITPKPTRLIDRILRIATKPGDIVLDSFAGSGTTAHSVLKLNREDGGNRKFILIEMMDYADSLTAERVRRVIGGYGGEDKRVAGTGGGFSCFEMGPTLFLDDGSVNPEAGRASLMAYLRRIELGAGHSRFPGLADDAAAGDTVAADAEDAAARNRAELPDIFIGEADGVSCWLAAPEPLDFGFLRRINRAAERFVIWAESCSLDESFLERNRITYKKIPRDIPKV